MRMRDLADLIIKREPRLTHEQARRLEAQLPIDIYMLFHVAASEYEAARKAVYVAALFGSRPSARVVSRLSWAEQQYSRVLDEADRRLSEHWAEIASKASEILDRQPTASPAPTMAALPHSLETI